jgi:hypothetical protein
MATEPETTRIVRSWLSEGRTALPDHILDAVLAELPTTHQRRPLLPMRRIDDMHAFAKLAMAAAAVVVVAIVGINLLPGSNGVGGGPAVTPSPSPSPIVSPSPTGTPRPSPSDLTFFPDGVIEPGRHSIIRSGKSFSLDIPRGWTSHLGFRIFAQSGQAAFIFWTEGTPTNVYADPCAHAPLDPPAGDTPAELAAAISSIPGTDLIGGPSGVTVGGYPAQLVTIQVREDVECTAQEFFLWYREAEGPDAGARWPDQLGDTINTWIIDVDGTIVWIDGSWSVNTTPALHEEMLQIVDSIQFE